MNEETKTSKSVALSRALRNLLEQVSQEEDSEKLHALIVELSGMLEISTPATSKLPPPVRS